MHETVIAAPAATICASCGTEVGAGLLSCPICRRLVHAGELRRLAAEVERATEAGEREAALTCLHSMLELLPAGSRQHQEVREQIDTLSRDVESRADALTPGKASRPIPGGRRLGRIGAALAGGGLLLWKFKFALGFLLTKGKLLILGLTKMSTFSSMLLSFGVYWTAWGWRFALGLVLSIYVHEMGHVAALRRFGIRASAPMFLPGIGAMVRLKQYPATPREEARVSLAGPMWGLAGAVATYGAHLAMGWGALAAIARVAAWINLFNLLPVWQLDGGRAFGALTRSHRWMLVLVIAAMWLLTREGLLILLLAASILRALPRRAPAEPDRRALAEFAFLVAGLSLLVVAPVPAP